MGGADQSLYGVLGTQSIVRTCIIPRAPAYKEGYLSSHFDTNQGPIGQFSVLA